MRRTGNACTATHNCDLGYREKKRLGLTKDHAAHCLGETGKRIGRGRRVLRVHRPEQLFHRAERWKGRLWQRGLPRLRLWPGALNRRCSWRLDKVGRRLDKGRLGHGFDRLPGHRRRFGNCHLWGREAFGRQPSPDCPGEEMQADRAEKERVERLSRDVLALAERYREDRDRDEKEEAAADEPKERERGRAHRPPCRAEREGDQAEHQACGNMQGMKVLFEWSNLRPPWKNRPSTMPPLALPPFRRAVNHPGCTW